MQSGRWERISKKSQKQNSWVRPAHFFFLSPAASPDVERVNPSAYVSRCVASAHAACPSCVLTPQLHRTVTLRHKKACKARSVNASCLRPRSFEPVQPTGISSQTQRQSCGETDLACLFSHTARGTAEAAPTIIHIHGTNTTWAQKSEQQQSIYVWFCTVRRSSVHSTNPDQLERHMYSFPYCIWWFFGLRTVEIHTFLKRSM